MKQRKSNRTRALLAVLLLLVVAALCFASCKKEPAPNEGGDPAVSDPTVDPGVNGEGGETGGAVGTDSDTEDGTDTDTDTEEETGPLCEGEHTYDEGVITTEATCTAEGVKTYTCSTCGHELTEAVPMLAHPYGDWETVTEPTYNEKGLEHRLCTECGVEEKRDIAVLPATFYITMELGNGKTVEWGVGPDGAYEIADPIRVGYEFLGWRDENNLSFPSSGTISQSYVIEAQWKLLETKTLEELIERAGAGTDRILLTRDIVIDQPVFFTGKTQLYSETAVKLSRAPGYGGDLFVVGQAADGTSSILLGSVAELSFGRMGGSNENILLTLDGNAANVTAKVVGSAIFLIDGGCLTTFDGTAIVNHKKVDNERSRLNESFYIGTGETIGGAAVMIAGGSSFNMMGGVIRNNAVNLTSTLNENGEAVNRSAYGGAIYNNGVFHMYGGVIADNSANRGGGIYTNRVTKILSGTLENNYATNKGGAICSSGSDGADTFLGVEGSSVGSVTFHGNRAGTQGGAILSYYDSPLIIYDGVLFDSNVAEKGNGGAISTTGPVTAYNTTFKNNSADDNGGAIYHAYAASEATRELRMEGCLLEGNRANKGGAITATSTESEGKSSKAIFKDCRFVENVAYLKITQKTNSETGEVTVSRSTGNGGAIYASQRSNVTVDGCSFSRNHAECLGGGAIGATVSSTVRVTNSSFTGNYVIDNNEADETLTGVGGALYVYNHSTVTVKNVTFEGNSASKNGGAVYSSANTVAMENVTFRNNTAGLHGGAISQHSASELTVKGIVATGNTAAGNGGVIYNNKSTLQILSGEGVVNTLGMMGENDEATLALRNTAEHGGAVCGGNTSVITLSGVTLTNNAASGNGGAVYGTYSSTLTLSGNTLSDNSAMMGGGVYVGEKSVLTDTDSTYRRNSAYRGGGLHLAYESDLTGLDVKATVKNASFLENRALQMGTSEASARGGAIYVGEYPTLKLEDSVLEGNTAEQYGGAVSAARGAVISVKNTKINGNGADVNGGAFWAYSDSRVTLENAELKNNTAGTNGGAIFTYSELKVSDTILNENSARYGGAIYASSGATTMERNALTGNTATQTGGAVCLGEAATLTDRNSSYDQNEAYQGGAIYLPYEGETPLTELKASITGSSFKNNAVKKIDSDSYKARGGAIYVGEQLKLQLAGVILEGNSAEQYGGAISAARGSHLTVSSATLKNNGATTSGGAVWLYHGAEMTVADSAFEGNRAKNGGAVYMENTAIFTDGAADSLANGSVFTGNTATSGGAILVNEATASETAEGALTLYGSSFTGNSASLANVSSTASVAQLAGGGAITAKSGAVVTAKGCTFASNLTYAPLQSTIPDNTRIYGGAVAVIGAKLNVEGGHFSANTFAMAEGSADYTPRTYGGAIGVYGGGAVNVSGVPTFTENEGRYGGAIGAASNEGAMIRVDAAIFTDNRALANGGAFYLNDASAELRQIHAEGNTTSGGGGVLYASSCDGITVSESTMTGNRASTNGGAICVSTALTLKDSILSENTASKAGGAVYGSSATTVVGCLLQKNVAGTTGGAVHVAGGSYSDGVDTVDGETSVVNRGSTYEGNLADHGGAIYAAKGAVTLEGATFKSNGVTVSASNSESEDTETGALTATQTEKYGGDGGAIYLGKQATLTDSGSTYTDNVAENGGAIFAGGNTIALSGSTFTGNKAISKKITATTTTPAEVEGDPATVETVVTETYGYGGAIYVAENGALNDIGSAFKGNLGANGGAIYLAAVANPEATPDSVAGKATLEDSRFESNTANYGGAIYVAKGAVLTDTESTYLTNGAIRGGAIYLQYEGTTPLNEVKATIDGSVFTENKALTKEGSSDAGRGGAIFVAEVLTLKVQSATFTGNEATQYGGAISAARNATVELTDSTLTGNVSHSRGGGIWLYTGSTLTVERTVFEQNETKTDGGAIYGYGVITMRGNTFTQNVATSGGAVFGEGMAAVLTDGVIGSKTGGSDFTGNTATLGGAIYVTKGALTVYGASFTGNSAKGGGAIYVTEGNANVNDSVFTGNTATETASGEALGGGAIAAHSGATVMTNSCTFTSNTAGNFGGALYANASTLAVNDGAMDQNKTLGTSSGTSYGGAIDARAEATVTVTGTKISGSSGYSGGAISSYGTGVTVTLNRVELAENGGQNGVIYIGAGGTVTVTDLNAHDNVTKGNGAVVYVTSAAGSTLTVNSATLSGNKDKNGTGFVVLSNAKNVLNINKSAVTGTDVANNWDTLIKNSKGAAVNELPAADPAA